jgi:hypothetical protein
MNRTGQSRGRQNVSFQTITVGHSPLCRRQFVAEGSALFRPTLAVRSYNQQSRRIFCDVQSAANQQRDSAFGCSFDSPRATPNHRTRIARAGFP